MRNRGPHGSVSNTQTEQIPWAWLLENRSRQIVDPITFQIPQVHWDLQSRQYTRHTENFVFLLLFFYLVGNMRLLTLPWCAVKRHFNLISLNNFLGYDALSFDCQGCLIIWFYIWEICNRVYFHFSQEHTWHHDVKTIFLGSLLLVIWLHLAAKVVFSVWIKAACERFSREHCHVFPWVNRTEPTRQISL